MFIDENEETNEEKHIRKSKEDKIFNNGYKSGEGISEESDFSHSSEITISSDYSDRYLKDIYNYEEDLDSKFILDAIFSIIKADPGIKQLLEDLSDSSKSDKLKFDKVEINYLFNRITKALKESPQCAMFNNSIYILEVISAISHNEYKKLFDMLDTDIQELLLIELNEKYKFLEGKNKKKIH